MGSMLIVTLVLSGILLCLSSESDKPILGAVFLCIACLLAYLNPIISPSVDPIDVYRGRTKLEIRETVVDDIVVETDTTVVYK